MLNLKKPENPSRNQSKSSKLPKLMQELGDTSPTCEDWCNCPWDGTVTD
ncbi:MAG: hypothetical protein ACRCXZ_05665 [Patescibacteria group bacterium]